MANRKFGGSRIGKGRTCKQHTSGLKRFALVRSSTFGASSRKTSRVRELNWETHSKTFRWGYSPVWSSHCKLKESSGCVKAPPLENPQRGLFSALFLTRHCKLGLEMPQKLICIFAGTAGSMINSLKLVTETIRWEVRGPYGQRAAKYEAANSSHMVESQRVAKIASKCGRTQTIIGRPSTLPKSSLFGQKVSACVHCTLCSRNSSAWNF